MSPWQLMIQQQFLKPLQTRSGTFSLLVSLAVWVLFLYYPIRKSAEAMANPAGPASSILNSLGLENLQNWALPELGAYWALALYTLPLYAILSSADLFTSERLRGGLRFLLLRVSRRQIFFSRLSGQMLIQLILLLVTLFSACLMGILRTDQPAFLTEQLPLLLITSIQLIISVMPFIALMAVFSILMNKPRSATLLAMVLFSFGEGIFNWLGSKIPGLDLFANLVPGNQLSEMLNTLPEEAWPLLIYPCGQTLLFVIGGYILFRRQAV